MAAVTSPFLSCPCNGHLNSLPLTKLKDFLGPYKRTQTAAHWQAKFYLPWQAANAAVDELWQTVAPQRLVYCGAAVEEP